MSEDGIITEVPAMSVRVQQRPSSFDILPPSPPRPQHTLSVQGTPFQPIPRMSSSAGSSRSAVARSRAMEARARAEEAVLEAERLEEEAERASQYSRSLRGRLQAEIPLGLPFGTLCPPDSDFLQQSAWVNELVRLQNVARNAPYAQTVADTEIQGTDPAYAPTLIQSEHMPTERSE